MKTTLKTVSHNKDGSFIITDYAPPKLKRYNSGDALKAAIAAFNLPAWFHSAHREIKGKIRNNHMAPK
jgi:hypothetical protein